MSEIISYDLTTPRGLADAAANYVKENPAKKAAMAFMDLPFGLGMALGEKIAKLAFALFENPEKMIEAQRKTAVDLIKAGKEHGASKVSVTLDQKAGIDIGSELNGFPMKFSVGTNGQITIEVEYK